MSSRTLALLCSRVRQFRTKFGKRSKNDSTTVTRYRLTHSFSVALTAINSRLLRGSLKIPSSIHNLIRPRHPMIRVETRVTSVQVVQGFPASLAIPNPPGWDCIPPSCPTLPSSSGAHVEPWCVAPRVSSRIYSLSLVPSRLKTSRKTSTRRSLQKRLISLSRQISHLNLCTQPSPKRPLCLPTQRSNCSLTVRAKVQYPTRLLRPPRVYM